MSNHTPGPWTVDSATPHAVKGGGRYVATATMREAAQTYANARLIAASPDLLHYCKSMLLFIETYGGEVTKNYSAAIPDVKAAIDKAEGK